MVNPVPGYSVTTPYHKANNGNWNACGWHTGQDYAAPYGQTIVAARSGQVVHVNFGSAFGNHQFVIRPGDGTQDFYAHTGSRPGNGAQVTAGNPVAIVDAEGNATGTHLHFERHEIVSDSWPDCGYMDDPMKSHNASGSSSGGGGDYPTPTSNTVYLSKLKQGQMESDSVWYLQRSLNQNGNPPEGASLPLTGNFLDQTATAVKGCQQAHGFGDDPMGSVFVGRKQAEHLFEGWGLTIKD